MVKSRRWIGALLLLASGCATAGGSASPAGVVAACPGTADPMPADDRCGLVCRAELPVHTTQTGSPLIDVWVNDSPVRLLFDTGASTGGLMRGTMNRLGVGAETAQAGVLTGIGGAVARGTVAVRSVAFGHVRQGPLAMEALTSGISGAEFDGLLGADTLGRYQVDLDLPHNVVRLYEGKLCPGPLPGWASDDGPVPFVPWVHSGHIVVDAKLDGAPVTALLDTGAQGTMVGLAAAHADGVTDADLASELGVRLTGVGPAQVPGRTHRFASIAIGPETVVQPETQVAALGFRHPEMVVGFDFFRTHKVWIDYADRVVHFAHAW